MTASSTDRTAPGPVRPALPLIFSITLTGILANTLPTAALPDILEHFDQPDSAAGFFVTAGALPGVIMAPVIGVLADRYGRRRVLIPCLASFGFFGVASVLAPTYAVLLGLRLAQGLGAAGLVNLAVVLIGDYWDGIDRARIIGYNAAVLTVSIAILPAAGGALEELGGWKWSFAPYALAFLTAYGAARLPHDHAQRNASVSLGGQFRAAKLVLKDPIVFTTLAFGFVLFILIFGLFLVILPLLLENDFGLSAGPRGAILAASGLASTAVALNLGRLRRRFGGGLLIIGACALFVAGFLLAGLAGSVVVVIIGVALYGLGEGASIPTLQDIVAGAAPDESRGAVVAVWVSAVRLGQSIGPLIAGIGIASLGESSTFVVAGLFTAVLGIAVFFSPLRSLERPGSAAMTPGLATPEP
jgi:MFS family permease